MNLLDLWRLSSLCLGSGLGFLSVVVFLSFHFSLSFKSLNNGGLGPAYFFSEVAEDGHLSEVLDSKSFESVGYYHSLSFVIRMRAALENLKSSHSLSTFLCFVGNHSSDDLPEDSAGADVVDVAALSGVDNSLSALVIHELDSILEDVT